MFGDMPEGFHGILDMLGKVGILLALFIGLEKSSCGLAALFDKLRQILRQGVEIGHGHRGLGPGLVVLRLWLE